MSITEIGRIFTGVFPRPSGISRVLAGLTSLAASSNYALLRGQTVTIKLVDGRNGHPLSHSCVNVWVGDRLKETLAIPTDQDGNARLRLTNTAAINTGERWKGWGLFGVHDPVVKYGESISVNAGYARCQSGGSNYSWLVGCNCIFDEATA